MGRPKKRQSPVRYERSVVSVMAQSISQQNAKSPDPYGSDSEETLTYTSQPSFRQSVESPRSPSMSTFNSQPQRVETKNIPQASASVFAPNNGHVQRESKWFLSLLKMIDFSDVIPQQPPSKAMSFSISASKPTGNVKAIFKDDVVVFNADLEEVIAMVTKKLHDLFSDVLNYGDANTRQLKKRGQTHVLISAFFHWNWSNASSKAITWRTRSVRTNLQNCPHFWPTGTLSRRDFEWNLPRMITKRVFWCVSINRVSFIARNVRFLQSVSIHSKEHHLDLHRASQNVPGSWSHR